MDVERVENVVVVGGGLGGLATAALLARRGLKPIVLEKSPSIGGRAVTHELGGQRFNLGPHAFYLGGHAARVLEGLRIPSSGGLARGQGGLAVRRGRLHTLPSGPLSMLTTGLLGLGAKLELGRVLATIDRIESRPLAAVPLREWVERTFASEPAREVLYMLARLSTYCADLDRLSAGVVVDQLRLAGPGVRYLDGGWQSLVDGLAVELERSSVPVRTGVRVERLLPGRTGWQVHTPGGVLDAQAVVLACPPLPARGLLRESGATGLETFDGLEPVHAACLDLALEALPMPKRFTALGVDVPLYAAVHSHLAKLSDDGKVVLQLARYLREADEAVGVEAELESLADLMQPGWRAQVIDRRFLPKMTVTHALPSAALRGTERRPPVAVEGAPGLYVVGDWAGARGHLLDAVMASAEEASEAVGARALRSTGGIGPGVVPLPATVCT